MAIILRTVSDSSQAQADLAKLRESVNGIQSSVDKVSNSFSNFVRIASLGIAGYATIQSVTRLSDELTNLETKLRLVTSTQTEFSFALDSVRKIANSTRSDLQSVASLYSRLSRAGKDFGASQSDIAKATDLISKAMATSGSGAQEANAAIQQLGQALASGKLAGDELRSILENAPPLAEAIAKGLGVSIGKLRQLGEEGKLSSVNVFKAILKQQDQIEKNFSKVTVTYGQAFQNLGNSLVILFDEVKKAALGSTSSFAESINNLANSIFRFATNLGFTLAAAKLKLVLFVTDSVLLFQDLWEALKETGVRVEESTRNLYDKWQPTLLKLTNDISNWAKYVAAASASASVALYKAFSETNIGQAIINTTKSYITTIRQFITTAFNTISSQIPKIDVREFFPGLDSAIAYVRSWAIEVEKWFFWLYNKVIGNSWIPDLVQKTGEWLGKLNKKPLALIGEFVEKANIRFAGLQITAPFIAGIATLYKFRGILFSILGIATALGAAFAGFTFLKGGSLEINQEAVAGQKPNKLEDLTKRSISWLQKVRDQVAESFDTSEFGRNIKQLLGISDTTPGSIYGVQIDTEAQVGRGPYRSSMDRPFGHDFINMLPPGWQVPLIAGFTGIFVLAIVKAFEAGPVRSVLISLFTTLGAIFASRVVDDKAISNSFGKAAFTFIDIVEKGITALFSGSVLNDPLGVLSTIAKTALLFQAGREAITKAGIAIATAPTKAAQTVTSVLERNLLRKDIDRSNKEISSLPTNLKAAVNANQAAFSQTVNQLAQLRDANGALIGNARALAAINSKNLSAFGTLQSRIKIGEGIRNQGALTSSQQDLSNVRELRRELVQSRDESQRREKLITENLKAQGDAFRAGITNIAAGAGGILGGLAGLQIGTEIARGMTDSPQWVKVGTALGISFVGQAVGAGIGSIIAQTFIASVGLVGSLIGRAFLLTVTPIAAIIANPFVLAAGALVAIITAALNWDTLKSVFKDFSSFWDKNITPILNGLVTRLEAVWDDLKKSISPKLEKPVADLPVIGEVSRKDVVDITATGGITAAILAKLGAFDKLIGTARNVIASNLAGISMQLDLARQTITTAFGNLRGSLGSLGTLGTVVMTAIAGVLSFGAVKASIVAGVAYLVYKFISNLTDLFVDETKKQAPKSNTTEALINQIPGRATGGWIRGPGTSTSDSIPAMLSNGEFVVNAKDAAKNWDILTAINSGMRVSRFAEGTTTSSSSPTIIAGQIFDQLKKLLGFDKPKETSTSSLPSGEQVKGTIQGLLESSGNLDKAFEETKKSLERAGFEKVDLKAIQELSKRDPAQFRKFAAAIDDANKAILNSTNKRLSEFLRNENLQKANEVFASIASSIAAAGIATVPSKFVDIPEEKKPTKITVGDEFKIVQEAFPELGLSLQDFSEISDRVRESLLRNAAEIAKSLNALNTIEIGTLEGGLTNVLGNVNERRQEIERERFTLLQAARDSLQNLRVPFKDLKIDFDKIGLNISEDIANILTPVDAAILKGLVDGAKKSLDTVRNVDVSPEIRRKAQQEFGAFSTKIAQILQDAPLKDSKTFEGVKYRLSQADVGLSIDRDVFNRLSKTELQQVEAAVSRIKDNQKYIKDLQEKVNAGTVTGFENRQLFEQGAIDKDVKLIQDILNKRTKDFKDTTALAGEAFASSIADSLSNSIAGVLKGEIEKPRDFFKVIGKSLADSVINTFVKGLMDPLTGENGVFTTALKGLGSSLFKGGASISTGQNLAPSLGTTESGEGGFLAGLQSLFAPFFTSLLSFFGITSAATTAQTAATTVQTGLMTSQNLLLTTANTLLATIESTLLAIFARISIDNPAFASGGYVSGAGTGTSDSISAMLSNGEFVINAKSTKQFRPFLEAINSNNIKKFATGGIVGASLMTTPAMAEFSSNKAVTSNQTAPVINIQITGDISRQTRSEIYKMLPSIAEGVNLHNREKGNR